MKVLSIATLVCAVAAMAVADVPAIQLNSHHPMPQIGLGTYQATGNEVVQAVKDALEIGYRHIDTAEVYNNEKDVGKALHEQIAKGIVKREDVFITTKVGGWVGSNEQKALQTVHNSLKYLNVTYLDLVLVHYPYKDYVSAYKGLETAVNQKLTRSIGVSNFKREHIDNLLKTAKIQPAVNQISIQPKNNEDDIVSYCKSKGIAVTGYSPLGQGGLIKNPTLVSIGKKHNKSGAQVAIRWAIQRGLITIPKATHKNYIEEDFKVFDFQLTDDEMKTIHNLH